MVSFVIFSPRSFAVHDSDMLEPPPRLSPIDSRPTEPSRLTRRISRLLRIAVVAAMSIAILIVGIAYWRYVEKRAEIRAVLLPSLQNNRHYAHGYRFTFAKSDRTRSYVGDVSGFVSYAVLGVRLNVEPVVHTLESSSAWFPVDLPQGPSRSAVESLLFRGILLGDERRRFRPNESISRYELATAITHTIHLEPSKRKLPRITDAPHGSPEAEEIALVVGARLMDTNAQGAFRVTEPVTRHEAAKILVLLSETYNGNRLACEPVELTDVEEIPAASRQSVFAAIRSGLVKAHEKRFQPGESFTRQQTAEAIYRILGFPWERDRIKLN